MAKPKISKGEDAKRRYEEFHLQYGIALSYWATLEENLCGMFCDLCGLDPDGDAGPAIFFSGRSFATRADLLSAAIRTSELGETEKALFRAILKKARQFSTARNAIAHGVPTNFKKSGNPYQGWRIKEGERTWEEGGIGIDQLRQAEANFRLLIAVSVEVCLALFPKKRRKAVPLETYLERVQALPNNAYSLEEAQNLSDSAPPPRP